MDKYLDYQLCYVSCVDPWGMFELYFTNNFNDQWGDDWNDRPAESNAEPPYEDDNHKIFSIIIKLNGISDFAFGGSIYSVEDINKGKACWLTLNDIYIDAKLTLKEIINIINEYNRRVNYDIIDMFIKYIGDDE